MLTPRHGEPEAPTAALLNFVSSSNDLEALALLARHMASATLTDFTSGVHAYNWVASASYALCCGIDAALHRGTRRDAILSVIQPAREAISASPFVHRLQRWPRGYPGDFETIEYLCDSVNRAPSSTLAHHFERFYLSTPPASQHRNKLNAQALHIIDMVAKNPNARILVVAAGGGRDLLLALPTLRCSGATVIINDTDPDAILLCQSRLEALGTRLEVLQGNALKVACQLEPSSLDLIVCGGLFDYLPTHLLKRFLRSLHRLLTADGRLFCTNVVEANPYRTWLEYCADWVLIGRSSADLAELFSDPRAPYSSITAALDPTGLAHLIIAKKSTPIHA